jgi:hypothetical protein
MDWYVTRGIGEKPIGPFPEEHVAEMIRSGMQVAAVHQKGEGEWAAPDSHPPFAVAQQESGRGEADVRRAVVAASPSRHSGLQRAAYIAIIIGVVMYAGDAVSERIRLALGASTGLDMSAYSSTEAAIATLTNRKPFIQWACYRGQVTRKADREKVFSAVVCTGEMKPMTTVSLHAPYPPGQLHKLCSKEDRVLGIDRFDWDLCEFQFVDSP